MVQVKLTKSRAVTVLAPVTLEIEPLRPIATSEPLTKGVVRSFAASTALSKPNSDSLPTVNFIATVFATFPVVSAAKVTLPSAVAFTPVIFIAVIESVLMTTLLGNWISPFVLI